MALLAVLDEHGIEVVLPRCGLIEIAAVSTRLANTSASEEIWNEVEMSFTIVPEDRLIESAKKMQSMKVARVLIPISLRLPSKNSIPLFTDDLGMHRISERRTICSWLLRDIDLKTVIPFLK
ncbi:MAG: hypothetical protein Q7T80_15095 [Methanoregula sp.]|nr:hypothetical protein [Methanoregula sp.]